MTQRYIPLDASLYRIPKAQILLGIWLNGVAPRALVNVGDYDDLNLSYEIEETEIVGNDSLVQETRAVIQTKRGGSVTFSSRQAQEILKIASYLGTKTVVEHDANDTFELTGLTNIEVGHIFESELPDATDAEIAVDAVTFTYPEHLSIVDNGDIEVIALPAGYAAVAATPGTLTVTGAATASESEEIAMLSTDGVTVRMKIVQLNKGGDTIVIPKIKLRPDGDIALGTNSAEPIAISFTGKIEKDITQPANRRLGYAIANRRAAA